MRYATTSQGYNLPPPEPSAPAIFSVPRKGGGYVYYQAPEGVAPGLGDNWPDPVMPHPNPLGVASTAIGRVLPPGSVRIGEGDQARGSITPLPGQGGTIPGLDASLGDVSMEDMMSGDARWLIFAAVALGAAYIFGRSRQ